jgi:cell filamentation protein
MVDKYGVGRDIYCFPDSSVLINQLGIKEQTALDAAELEFTQWRSEQYVPDFQEVSFATLCGIHFFLFKDLYSWAGKIRAVDISKGATRFANVRCIEREAHKYFQCLAQENFLAHLPKEKFVARLSHYYSELNVIHPFRDGNGRAQRILFETIVINAGYEIRWQTIEEDEWLTANIAAYNGNLSPLADLLERATSFIST